MIGFEKKKKMHPYGAYKKLTSELKTHTQNESESKEKNIS